MTSAEICISSSTDSQSNAHVNSVRLHMRRWMYGCHGASSATATCSFHTINLFDGCCIVTDSTSLNSVSVFPHTCRPQYVPVCTTARSNSVEFVPKPVVGGRISSLFTHTHALNNTHDEEYTNLLIYASLIDN